MSPRAMVLTAIVAALTLASCGGNDEAEVRERVLAYYDAIADRDYAAACDQFADAQRKLVTAGTTRSCARELRERLEDTDADDLDNLHGVSVEEVRVDGVRAFATLNGGHTMELVDEDGWRILDPGR